MSVQKHYFLLMCVFFPDAPDHIMKFGTQTRYIFWHFNGIILPDIVFTQFQGVKSVLPVWPFMVFNFFSSQFFRYFKILFKPLFWNSIWFLLIWLKTRWCNHIRDSKSHHMPTYYQVSESRWRHNEEILKYCHPWQLPETHL